MIDPVIHAPARLAIVTTLNVLAPGDALRFPVLQELTQLTAGNLVTHLRRLEEAGYVATRTSGGGRASVTSIALTSAGRDAFAAYRAELMRLLVEGPTPVPDARVATPADGETTP